MQNLPKPPKLYYYLAGLAIFILILGSAIYYFNYNKNLTTQNSLTSSLGQTKSLGVPNNRLEEENLTLKPLIADQAHNVETLDECGLSVKYPKELSYADIFKNSPEMLKDINLNDEYFLSKREFGVSKKLDSYSLGDYVFGSNQEFNVTIDCKNSQTQTPQPKSASDFIDTKFVKEVSSFEEKYDNWSGGSGTKKGETILLHNGTKIKITDEHSLFKTFDLKIQPVLLNKNLDTANLSKISDIGLVGCENNATQITCSIIDQNKNTIKTLFTKNNDSNQDIPESYLGKKSALGRYIITKFFDGCNEQNTISEFNFQTAQQQNIENANFYIKDCVNSTYFLEMTNCETSGEYKELGRKCFKSESKYQGYVKEYRDEQALNKSARAELAKYLE